MKQATRSFIGDWLLPPAFARLLMRSIHLKRKTTHIPREKAVLSRNAKFRNMYAGRRCFVIGNGPSLNNQDLGPLGNEITIVMNRFNRHPVLGRWQPTIFCMAEPGAHLEITGLATFVEKVHPSAYFFRTDVKQIVDREKLLPEEEVYYLRATGPQLHDWRIRKNALDLTRTVPGFFNTSLMAIFIAMYMGCSPIYLIGLDHDWLARRTLDAHFYSESDKNPALPGLPGSSNWTQYHTLLEMAVSVWKSHEFLRDMASARGLMICDATAGGFLDVYPRVEYEKLFPSEANRTEARREQA